MTDLLQQAIDAQGGLDRWRQFYIASSHLTVGGILWEMKGHGGVIDKVNVEVNLLEQKTSHIPGETWHTVYTPDRIAIETGNGDLVEERYNPRASFHDHQWETKWSNLQLAYFSGYATWNYFNTPFLFARPGFKLTEVEPWAENGQTWRRLHVVWPKDIHTHSKEQTLYIGSDGLIRRLDYRVEVAGNAPCAHYLSNYKVVAGITIATRREVYLLGEHNMPKVDSPVIVSIDFSDIRLE